MNPQVIASAVVLPMVLAASCAPPPLWSKRTLRAADRFDRMAAVGREFHENWIAARRAQR